LGPDRLAVHDGDDLFLSIGLGLRTGAQDDSEAEGRSPKTTARDDAHQGPDSPSRGSLRLGGDRRGLRGNRLASQGDGLDRRASTLELVEDGLVDPRVGLLPELLHEGLEGLGLLLPLQAVLDLGADRLEGALLAFLPPEELHDVEALAGHDEVGELSDGLEREARGGELLTPEFLEFGPGAEGEVAASSLGAVVVGPLLGEIREGVPILAPEIREGPLGLGADLVAARLPL